MKKILITLFLFLYGVFAFSHSGKTDENGCHVDKKTGKYHCHKPKKKSPAKKPAKPKKEQQNENN